MKKYRVAGKTHKNNQTYFILTEMSISPFAMEDDRVIEMSRDILYQSLLDKSIDVINYRIDSTGKRLIEDKRFDLDIQDKFYAIIKSLMDKYEAYCKLKWLYTPTKQEMISFKYRAACIIELESLYEYARFTIAYRKDNSYIIQGLKSPVDAQKYADLDEVYNALECGILTKFVNKKRNVISEDKMAYNMQNLGTFAHDFLNDNSTLCSRETLKTLHCTTALYCYDKKSEIDKNKCKYSLDIFVYANKDEKNVVKITVKSSLDGLYKMFVKDKYDDSYDSNDIGDTWKYIKTIVKYKLS